ncbi:MAG: ABC transporter permease, partial [Chlorobi bacterium]|nr:ABC transporter permease [Chlorobiota bacterium]
GADNEVEVLSERVFIEDRVYEAYGALPGARGVLTYFVNGIQKGKGQGGEKETPYSFVSTVSENELSPDEIIINQWLSDDLGAKTGDTLRLKYFVIGPLRQLKEETTPFVVKKVVGMHSRYADRTLMPFFPGLSDAGHCSEWEAGVPIDLGKIRNKDEDYWDDYKGTPKAFISIKTALKLWSNRFGDYTSIRFDKGGLDKAGFEEVFTKIPPSALGFSVAAVKDEGRLAAQNGVDFSQLFIGLSFFLLVAAILLAWLLFLLNLENRFSQIGTLSTLGFTSKQVKSIFLAEGVFVSIIGSLIGVVLAIFYTQIVFKALNSLWYDIVRTNILEIKLLPKTLFVGFLISNLITVLVINFSIRKKLKQQAADIQKKIIANEKKWVARVKWVAAILFLFSAIIIVFSQFVFSDSQNPSLFFMSGGLMLFSLLLFSGRILQYVAGRRASKLSILGLSIRNTVRNRNRSLTIIILFALGTFLVISTGANRQDMFANAYEKSSGTGGFLYFAETTMPVPFNMNDKAKRAEEGLSEDFSVVQLRKVEGDDASCLNLNRVSNPTILGVNPGELEGRFSFVKSPPGQDKPWQSLSQELDGGVVPAIADQTVILWGLGKKVGDTLNYLNETGDTLRLKLIGGLAPSIFQGYVIIGNNHFLGNFPTSSGSSVFLIDGNPEKSKKIAEELYLNFRDYGWEMSPAPQRLAEFYSVTNTYLSIFLALGALGLALGTIGMAIVLARSMLERKNEIALMKAVGFPNRTIFNVVAREYTGLLSAGVFIGLLAAILATLPSLTSANTGVSVSTILIIVLAVLLNGFIWVVLLTSLSLKNKKLILALKNE